MTKAFMKTAKHKRRAETKHSLKKAIFKKISKHDVRNAFTERGMPMSDSVHGIYRMTPPELLHTSGSGLIKYMFSVLVEMFGGTKAAMEMRELIDHLHQQITADLDRSSERRLPRGSIRNGIIDPTKTQSTENSGNLFRLLCLAHTTEGKRALKWMFDKHNIDSDRWVVFLKNYLAMEAWFHEFNPKAEVQQARSQIAKILDEMQELFPRIKGNGYDIPKHHGMTKMQHYMCLFGSGINFYGGPGESSHNFFVKAPGYNTQRRPSEFAKQVSNRIYECMVLNTLKQTLDKGESDQYELIGCDVLDTLQEGIDSNQEDEEDVGRFKMKGKYHLTISAIDPPARGVVDKGTSSPKWVSGHKRKMRSGKYDLHADLLRVIFRETSLRVDKGLMSLPCSIEGYTEMTTNLTTEDDTTCKHFFYAHPHYYGRPWYDWAYVHYLYADKSEKFFPSLVLGYVKMKDIDSGKNTMYAVIRTTIHPVPWSTLETEFIHHVDLSSDFKKSYVLAEMTSIVHPLAVFQNIGGPNNSHILCLPKINWGRYFGSQIQIDNNRMQDDSEYDTEASERRNSDDESVSDSSEDEVGR